MKRLAGPIAIVLAVLALANVAQAYDAKPWLEDLQQARAAFATKYANLEWAVFVREAYLDAMFRDAAGRIGRASDDAEARAAFDRLARRLGDGHVEFRWPAPAAGGGAAAAQSLCARLGYDARYAGPPLAALAPGYRPLSGGPPEFPAGVLTVSGRKVGVLRIGEFSVDDAPALCEAAAGALGVTDQDPCNDACADRLQTWAYAKLTRDLEDRLGQLKAAGAGILLIDIAGNGGGSEWVEAAVRMVTSVRLKAERMGFVRGPHWAERLARRGAALRDAAATATGADRALLLRLADEVEAARQVALQRCDSEPLWQGRRPGCAWLGQGFYATGLLASAAPTTFQGKDWGEAVFEPSKFPYREGVWRGPTAVLVDGDTASAAEEFAAELRDNHAAVVIGAPTSGAGCGHTDGGAPTTLTHSGGVLSLPDCVRWRADGSNEVEGVQPDVLVGLRANNGPRRNAELVMRKLPEALRQAVALRPAGVRP